MMAGASPSETGPSRLLIRGSDGIGKSTFEASVRPLPAAVFIGGRNASVGSSSPEPKEVR